MTVSGPAVSSSRKRRITPTAETISPKKIAVITSPGVVSPLINSIDPSNFPNSPGFLHLVELAHKLGGGVSERH
ncbi:hypothetical protein B0T26DRAFT_699283 [Lasiosphaeria miniovina]|uniref:Uncharacterized protein n=1 Tax=Lasiosphaeria miniovina TaxID=1954250 RepID=A0AA40EAX3_9PEZI|nr:uncharacterized protein B0T26DRAFT_699283 [Lasiosphaeria miniovina]KAK0728778.1 hypothetical protein B0T26DRAFT_699283 [Lasiosphaeria miniovina]